MREHFNSHAHVERDFDNRLKKLRMANFNSHAHVERDSVQAKQALWSPISTHTLTWSVTDTWERYLSSRVFQLTRSRGAWRGNVFGVKWASDFNSHAHVERDLLVLYVQERVHLFQLTRSRGAWLRILWRNVLSLRFQLTRSRGAWPGLPRRMDSDRHFNSHAHVERDEKALPFMINELISTHTLTWSVTQAWARRSPAGSISTHTLTWSVTIVKRSSAPLRSISTHTLTWSVT